MLVINSQSPWQRALTTKTKLPKCSMYHANCTENDNFQITDTNAIHKSQIIHIKSHYAILYDQKHLETPSK